MSATLLIPGKAKMPFIREYSEGELLKPDLNRALEKVE
jgi:hypothetical protein